MGLEWVCDSALMLTARVLTVRVAKWIRRRSPEPKIGSSSPPVGRANIFVPSTSIGTIRSQILTGKNAYRVLKFLRPRNVRVCICLSVCRLLYFS